MSANKTNTADAVNLDQEQFGTTDDYVRAFEAVRAEGISDKHDRMLRAHLAAPGTR